MYLAGSTWPDRLGRIDLAGSTCPGRFGRIDLPGAIWPDRLGRGDLAGPPAGRYPFFANGTGSPAILTLNEPRLVRVQKYTVFQSSPPNATLAVLAKPCTMRPSFLPFGADDVEPARTAAIDVSRGVDLHAVGAARLGSGEIDQHAVGRAGERAVRQHVEGADVPARRVVDVENRLVGREGYTVRIEEIIDEQRERSAIRRDAVDARVAEVPLAGRHPRRRAGPGIGEIDRAVGLHHDIVREIERAALEGARHHRDAAVVLLANDTPGRRLAGDQAPVRIAGEAVRGVGLLLEDRDRLARRIFPPLEIGAAEQEITPLLPPQRPLHIGGAAQVGGDIDDRLRRRDDVVERRVEPLDALCGLRGSVAIAGRDTSRRHHGGEHLPPRKSVLRTHGSSLCLLAIVTGPNLALARLPAFAEVRLHQVDPGPKEPHGPTRRTSSRPPGRMG